MLEEENPDPVIIEHNLGMIVAKISTQMSTVIEFHRGL